jgi:hypothetical protein
MKMDLFRDLPVTFDKRDFGEDDQEKRACYEGKLKTALSQFRALPIETTAKSAKIGILPRAEIGIVLQRTRSDTLCELRTCDGSDLSKLSSFSFELELFRDKVTFCLIYDGQKFRIWI